MTECPYPSDPKFKPPTVILTEIVEKVAMFSVVLPIIRGVGFIFVDLAPGLPQAELYSRRAHYVGRSVER